MQAQSTDILAWLKSSLIPVLMGVFGMTVRSLNRHPDDFNMKSYLAGLCTACFVSLVVSKLLTSAGVENCNIIGVAGGMAGYMAPDTLNMLKLWWRRLFSQKLDV
jgi:hypothetical protein